jgi:hypothetical protein
MRARGLFLLTGGDKLFKVRTVRELAQFEGMIDRGVHGAVLRILSRLDEVYGVDRDVDRADGGFVLIAENIQDLELIGQRYVRMDSNRHEVVDVVKCESGLYINALFLCHNEFGINVFMPMDIAPGILLKDLPQKIR